MQCEDCREQNECHFPCQLSNQRISLSTTLIAGIQQLRSRCSWGPLLPTPHHPHLLHAMACTSEWAQRPLALCSLTDSPSNCLQCSIYTAITESVAQTLPPACTCSLNCLQRAIRFCTATFCPFSEARSLTCTCPLPCLHLPTHLPALPHATDSQLPVELLVADLGVHLVELVELPLTMRHTARR